MWRWFHRVLLGTLLEVFRERGIALDAASLDLVFDDESVFQYPAFNNVLRFVGHARGRLLGPLSEADRAGLEAQLEGAWPDLVSEIKRFPVPDRLAIDRNEVTVEIEGDWLVVRFDLSAD